MLYLEYVRPCTFEGVRTAGKNKDRNSGNYRQAERDGRIHHPRSFEYRERRDDRGGSTKNEESPRNEYEKDEETKRTSETEAEWKWCRRKGERRQILRQVVHRYTRPIQKGEER